MDEAARLIASFLPPDVCPLSPPLNGRPQPSWIRTSGPSLSRYTGRAAYHASANSLAAAASCDIMRRDGVLRNCPGISATFKTRLHQAPSGGFLLFGLTWQAVKDSAQDWWPSATTLDPTRFQAARRAVSRSLQTFRSSTRPTTGGSFRPQRQPFFGRPCPAASATTGWPRIVFPTSPPAISGLQSAGG